MEKYVTMLHKKTICLAAKLLPGTQVERFIHVDKALSARMIRKKNREKKYDGKKCWF